MLHLLFQFQPFEVALFLLYTSDVLLYHGLFLPFLILCLKLPFESFIHTEQSFIVFHICQTILDHGNIRDNLIATLQTVK